MKLDVFLQCTTNAFAFLVGQGFAREELIADFSSFEPQLLELLPRLRCNNCGRKGSVTIYTKPIPKSKPAIKKVPFSQQLVGTDRGVNRIFHRQRCGFAQKIRREVEVFFQTRRTRYGVGMLPVSPAGLEQD